MKTKFILLLFTVLALALSCTLEEPLPAGDELMDRDNSRGVQPPLYLTATETAQYRAYESSGFSTRLLFGEKQGVSAVAILNSNLFYELDSTNVESASLYLYPADNWSLTPFTVNFYEFDQEWDEETVTWDDVQSNLGQQVESMEFTPLDSAWNVFEFSNLEFFQNWIMDQAGDDPRTTGLILTFDQAQSTVEWYSSDASGTQPFFRLITTPFDDPDRPDTTDIAMTSDASLMQPGSLPPVETLEYSPTHLRVGNGSGYRSLLRFDVDQVPLNATVHNVQLTMYVDKERSDTKSSGMFITPLPVEEDSTWSSFAALSVDSALNHNADDAVATVDTFVINNPATLQFLSNIYNAWIHDNRNSYGLLLYPENLSRDFQEMVFYSGEDDPDLKPTLKVTYSLPAEQRFSSGNQE